MSYALRHDPADAGIALTEGGWADADALCAAVRDEVAADVSLADVAAVVRHDPKGRFEADGNSVRATYGHSVDVDVRTESDRPVPDVLYHGTAPRNRNSILADGLDPRGRQHVHLTDDRDAAVSVGRRHVRGDASPVVFRVDCAGVVAAGHEVEHRTGTTYVTDHVPPECLTAEPDRTQAAAGRPQSADLSARRSSRR